MIDGLRAYKKQMTRQRISDVATEMFMARGFENVTVAEIAADAGVSEKTVYNYFPTKESLVYDQADAQLDRLVTAVRDRPRGATPTSAFVATLKDDAARFSQMLGEDRIARIGEYGEMVRSTPALRAAWGDYRHRVVVALREVLAADLGIDPEDPEPVVAARALVSLLELFYDSRARHARAGMTAAELQRLCEADIDRGARLLDTGMWSLHMMVEGRRTKDQIREARQVAEQARQQVLAALREAKRAWKSDARTLREQARAAAREAAREAQAAAREAHQQAREAAREAQAQAREAARETQAAAREAHQQAREAAREAQAAARDAHRQAREAARETHHQAHERRPPR